MKNKRKKKIYDIINNAVGFALAEYEGLGEMHGKGDEREVRLTEDELDRVQHVSRKVYDHLAIMGYIDYV